LFKADFHLHSEYSGDCKTTLEQIIQACQRKGINCIALSDHNSIEGALKLKEIAPFYVIVAEEILTTGGEIMGMFLTEKVPRDLSIEESIRRIKSQGGLLCAQHPYDKVRSDSLKSEVMNKIADQIDLVEVFNARTLFRGSSQQARKFAAEHHLPASAGSDAHTPSEIGNAYVILPEFKSKADFLLALPQGEIHGRMTGPLTRFSAMWAKLRKR
jgi:predicted metal-dependent phosphoesterase TrpH